jgi:hypothetical protein
MVAYLTFNQLVGGSSPPGPTRKFPSGRKALCGAECGCSSTVERLVPNQKAVGSIPIIRSGVI